MTEREKIVAWLRAEAARADAIEADVDAGYVEGHWRTRAQAVLDAANAIERGEHLTPSIRIECMGDMIERVARTMCDEYDALPERATYLERKTHPEREWRDRQEAREHARKVIAAMRYEDGTDESLAISVGNRFRHDPVHVIEAWDGMIDAALNERKD